MSVEGLLGTEEEDAARRLIERAAGALVDLDPNVPTNFLPQLYGRAVADDLVGYEPETLAKLGKEAWAFLGTRRPGAPKIRFETLQDMQPGSGMRPVSVIEIVTDDMPFLVDSVTAELTDQCGMDVRLGRASGLHGGTRRRRSAQNIRRRPTGPRGRAARKLHANSCRPGGRRSQAHRHRAGDRAGTQSGAARCAGLAADAASGLRHHRRPEEQSAADPGRRDRGSDPVPAMAGRRQFHLYRHARLRFRQRIGFRGDTGKCARHPARAGFAGAPAQRSAGHHHAADPQLSWSNRGR